MKEKYNLVLESRRKIFTNNLIGGLAWGIGATLGLSLLIAILGLLAHYVNLVPIVGNFVSEVINFIISKNPNL